MRTIDLDGDCMEQSLKQLEVDPFVASTLLRMVVKSYTNAETKRDLEDVIQRVDRFLDGGGEMKKKNIKHEEVLHIGFPEQKPSDFTFLNPMVVSCAGFAIFMIFHDLVGVPLLDSIIFSLSCFVSRYWK